MQNVCLQTYRNNRICWKLAYFLREIQTLRVNNSRILTIKNTKFSGYYFYMNLYIWGDSQICISVPLIDSHISHDEFVSVNNILREYNKTKKEIKNP